MICSNGPLIDERKGYAIMVNTLIRLHISKCHIPLFLALPFFQSYTLSYKKIVDRDTKSDTRSTMPKI